MFPLGVQLATPPPPIGTWEPPPVITDVPSSSSTAVVIVGVPEMTKFNAADKGDQHDSGIDNSETLNSAASSSRSSPSAENKIRAAAAAAAASVADQEVMNKVRTDVDLPVYLSEHAF